MFKQNCIFYLALFSCNVFLRDAHSLNEINKANENSYIVELFDVLNYTRKTDQGTYFTHCNGGIIGEEFIVTLASCVMNEEYQFLNGTLTIQLANTFYWLIDGKPIEALYVPRTYDSTTLRDNIALLKLAVPLELEKNGLRKLEIPSKTVEVGGRAEMTTGRLAEEAYSSNAYEIGSETIEDNDLFDITANIKIIGNVECRRVYPNLVENVTLCARLDVTSRPEKTRYAGRGSVAVVGGKTIVGLLARERDLSKDTDDVQMYTDIYSQLDFILNAMDDKTENIYRRINHWPLELNEEGWNMRYETNN